MMSVEAVMVTGSFDFLVGTTGSITRPLDKGTCNLEPRTGSPRVIASTTSALPMGPTTRKHGR